MNKIQRKIAFEKIFTLKKFSTFANLLMKKPGN